MTDPPEIGQAARQCGYGVEHASGRILTLIRHGRRFTAIPGELSDPRCQVLLTLRHPHVPEVRDVLGWGDQRWLVLDDHSVIGAATAPRLVGLCLISAWCAVREAGYVCFPWAPEFAVTRERRIVVSNLGAVEALRSPTQLTGSYLCLITFLNSLFGDAAGDVLPGDGRERLCPEELARCVLPTMFLASSRPYGRAGSPGDEDPVQERSHRAEKQRKRRAAAQHPAHVREDRTDHAADADPLEADSGIVFRILVAIRRGLGTGDAALERVARWWQKRRRARPSGPALLAGALTVTLALSALMILG